MLNSVEPVKRAQVGLFVPREQMGVSVLAPVGFQHFSGVGITGGVVQAEFHVQHMGVICAARYWCWWFFRGKCMSLSDGNWADPRE